MALQISIFQATADLASDYTETVAYQSKATICL
jgi:hypothetical protein